MDANRDVPNTPTPLRSLSDSSPMNLVEFGTGLFLSKTPSEEAPAPHEVLSGYVSPQLRINVPLRYVSP